MNKKNVIRMWKDEDYRNSISAEDLTDIPEHPSGAILMSDHELSEVFGGSEELELMRSETLYTWGCCEGGTISFISIGGCCLTNNQPICHPPTI